MLALQMIVSMLLMGLKSSDMSMNINYGSGQSCSVIPISKFFLDKNKSKEYSIILTGDFIRNALENMNVLKNN